MWIVSLREKGNEKEFILADVILTYVLFWAITIRCKLHSTVHTNRKNQAHNSREQQLRMELESLQCVSVAVQTWPNTYFFAHFLGTLVCASVCIFAVFQPLCHCSPSSTAASSPIINILALSRYITPGINHRFPWRWNHPCRCVCLCDSSSVHVFVCLLYADCTCSPPVRAVSAGDGAALAFRLAVTAV